MNAHPCRWFAVRRRTLFVVVLIVALPLGWGAHSLSWIRQRHAIRHGRHNFEYPLGGIPGAMEPSPPSGLWLFGETGYELIIFDHLPDDTMTVADLHKAYPEAWVLEQIMENKKDHSGYNSTWKQHRPAGSWRPIPPYVANVGQP